MKNTHKHCISWIHKYKCVFSNFSSSFDWNVPPYNIPDMYAKPGTPCDNYKGYCDVFQKCREVSINFKNVFYHISLQKNFIYLFTKDLKRFCLPAFYHFQLVTTTYIKVNSYNSAGKLIYLFYRLILQALWLLCEKFY